MRADVNLNYLHHRLRTGRARNLKTKPATNHFVALHLPSSGANVAHDIAPLGGAGATADVLHAEIIERARREIFHDDLFGGGKTAAILPRAGGTAILHLQAVDIRLRFEPQLILVVA